jgi:hypothetical protein
MFEMPATANGARAWRVVAKDSEEDHIPPFDLYPKAWLGYFVSASWARAVCRVPSITLAHQKIKR